MQIRAVIVSLHSKGEISTPFKLCNVRLNVIRMLRVEIAIIKYDGAIKHSMVQKHIIKRSCLRLLEQG